MGKLGQLSLEMPQCYSGVDLHVFLLQVMHFGMNGKFGQPSFEMPQCYSGVDLHVFLLQLMYFGMSGKVRTAVT